MESHVLFESAVGFALFRVSGAEVIGMEVDAVQEKAQDLSKFGKLVKLHALQPFKSAQDALDNMNQVSEGLLPDQLRDFLEAHLPSNPKKGKYVLGVADARMSQAINEALKVPCSHTDAFPELIRGIRLHFTKMCDGLKDDSLDKAQLGLGHSYSRSKVKFNVHRVDNMIIQAISLLDQLDKDINTFSMRIKEWYSYHFPELSKILNDNIMFARIAHYIGRRSTLTDESLEKLEEFTMDSAKAQQIMQAAKSSMGMDVSDIDLISMRLFAERVTSLADYRKSLFEYLKAKMQSCAPNLASLIGEQVGARLISHAGSLTNLAKYPASTVQILGAEKALFRALKTRGNTPKYGLIFHSSFIGRAGSKNKGRISRYLANKCSMASRIDCFSDGPTGNFGEELRSQVEERLSFYESGEAPRKNIDVMRKVIATLGDAAGEGETAPVTPSTDKKKKKKAKRAAGEADASATPSAEATPKSEKKAKKAKKDKADPDTAEKKKKKKDKKASE